MWNGRKWHAQKTAFYRKHQTPMQGLPLQPVSRMAGFLRGPYHPPPEREAATPIISPSWYCTACMSWTAMPLLEGAKNMSIFGQSHSPPEIVRNKAFGRACIPYSSQNCPSHNPTLAVSLPPWRLPSHREGMNHERGARRLKAHSVCSLMLYNVPISQQSAPMQLS